MLKSTRQCLHAGELYTNVRTFITIQLQL